MTYKFTTSIHKEGKWYVARCLELGVASQGLTIEEAQANLKEAVELYLEDNDSIVDKNFLKQAPFFTTLDVDYA